MTDFALCPNCGKAVPDTGIYRFIVCENCGRRIKSRVFGHKPQNRQIDIKSPMMGDDFRIMPDLRSTRRMDNRAGYLAPLRALASLLCLLAIVFFVIILIFNFIMFFPAIAVTLPELPKNHDIDIKTELPLVIDDSAPKISMLNYSDNCSAGETIDISVRIVDEHIKECNLKLEYQNLQNSTLTTILPLLSLGNDTWSDMYYTTLQVPPYVGIYKPIIIATDYAGNIATLEFQLTVIAAKGPILMLKSPENYTVVTSETKLVFEDITEDITKVLYTLDSGISYELSSEPYIISTKNWSTGIHRISVTVISNTSQVSNLNYSILVDNAAPELSSISLTPLTIDRNATFQNRLTENIFYRGELVLITVNIYDVRLHEAKVILEGNQYHMAPSTFKIKSEDKYNYYQTIISMPKTPGNYNLRLISTDYNGHSSKKSLDFQVASIRFNYVPVPILNLSVNPNEEITLPIINSTTEIRLPMVFGNIIRIQYMNITHEGILIINSSDVLDITAIGEGEVTLKIHANFSYKYWDYLFFSFPFSPFLFVVPYLITGWWLVVFYIFIITSIIASFLYLFRSSLKEALKMINTSAQNLRTPMMETKNSFITLGQIFLAVYSFNWLFFQILNIVQVPVRTPDFSSMDDWVFIYNLTTASVYEEIISRILLIGVPLFLIHAVMGKLKNPKRNYLLGGGFQINKLMIFLILFSSITFGLGHVPGWDYWKVIPTVISGCALGYLFLTHGIFTAILLHFMINFMSIPMRLFGYHPGLVLIYFFLILFWVAIGIIYMGYYLNRIKLFIAKRKSLTTSS